MAIRRTPRCPDCQHRLTGWDLRGTLTIIVVVLVFGLAYLQLALGIEDGATIAPWAVGALTLVLQGYYMTKGAERHAEALVRRVRGRSDDGPPPPQ